MVKAAKAALRKEIVEKLELLSATEKEKKSNVVIEKLFNLPEFKNSKRVSTFLSIDNEVNTEPIIRKIFEDGKQCYVPRCSKSAMEMVRLHSMEDWETLPLTKWNIKQPALKDQRENALLTGGLDLVIIPGVAFTKNGLRLGHGGGYYDKFLKAIKENEKIPPKTVAIAFKEQLVDNLPTEITDIRIDRVLYDD